MCLQVEVLRERRHTCPPGPHVVPWRWGSVAAASLVLSHPSWPLLTEVGLPFAFPLLFSLLSSACQQLVLGDRAGLADILDKTRKSPVLPGL